MKLRTLHKNKMKTYKNWNNINNNRPEEFVYLFVLDSIFEQIRSKIEKIGSKIENIKEMVIYEILEIEQNPKEYKRTLKRSKQ
jgi:hypothetical protein